MADSFLRGLLVVELGDRCAVKACGSVFAQLGANVILIESADPNVESSPPISRAITAGGKLSVRIDRASSDDRQVLNDILAASDVVLISSDMPSPCSTHAPVQTDRGPLICDISAFGSTGPLAGKAYSDASVQALAGLIDTTGAEDGPPAAMSFPLVELVGAVYAAAGILAGLRARRKQGISQSLEIALFDCAISTLATFLPGYIVGRQPTRIGNHHPSMSPWNTYRARDGWVLMCSGSDEQWRRVCDLMGCPELAREERFASPSKRLLANVELDELINRWTVTRSSAECVDHFNAAGISSGPVSSISDLFADPSLLHRKMFAEAIDPETHDKIRIPGSVFKGSLCEGHALNAVPAMDEHRAEVAKLIARRNHRGNRGLETEVDRAEAPKPALAGIRVLEIANYTAGPSVTRHLAALGAYVVKIEPPGGDLARPLPPHRGDQSYFFTMSNSDKRSLMLDLRKEEDKTTFRRLLSEADVFVENLKPRSLARLGFSTKEIAALNPKLVYCSITGYGNDSPYADRPGMDTTIQGMSGIMHLTQSGGVPYKNGISSADIAAGLFALVAVLAALEYREESGLGQALDISMLDAGTWLTHHAWNGGPDAVKPKSLMRCSDGYLLVECDGSTVTKTLGKHTSNAGTACAHECNHITRDEAATLVSSAGIACAPVLTVNEAVEHEQTVARKALTKGRSITGEEWPLLASPLHLSKTPPVVKRAIGRLGADSAEIAAGW